MKIIALFSLLASCLLVSCQPPAAEQQVSLNSKHWKLVNKTPPTYFPIDAPADQKTTHGNGFWVYSGDAQNTQYFIPFNKTKVPNKTLLAEAQSTLTKKMKQQHRRVREGDAIWEKDYVAKTILEALDYLGDLGQKQPLQSTPFSLSN